MKFIQDFIAELSDVTKRGYAAKAPKDLMDQLLKKGNLHKAAKRGQTLDKLKKQGVAESLSYEHRDMVDKLGKLTANRPGDHHDFHTQLERNGHIHLDAGWHKDTKEVRAHIKHMQSKGWVADGTDKGLALEPPK